MSAAPCPFEDEVLLLADGELERTRRVVVEAHLGVCTRCAELEETLALVEETIAAERVPPLGAAERALDRLPDTAPRLRPWLLAAAAAALVFFVVRGARSVPPGAPSTAPETAAAETETRSPQDDVPDAPALEDPLPVLPLPVAPAGPTLRRRLAAFDSQAADAAETAREIADDVRRSGPRGSRALALELGADGALTAAALSVACHVDAPVVREAVARLVGHPLYGDVAARAVTAAPDRGVVATLAAKLDGSGATAAREALAEIGGAEAARALIERFWVADEAARGAWLVAAVRADPALGGAACLEAAAAPAEPEAAATGLPALAARVVAEHREALLPYLRRTARGRDALRTRLAVRALGWARDDASRTLLAELARSPRTAGVATRALLDVGTPPAIRDAVEAARLGGPEGAAAAAFVEAAVAEPLLLTTALEGGDLASRRLALGLLARCGGPGAAVALDGARLPRALQGEAVACLGSIGGPEAADALAPYASVPGLEAAVVEALGRTGSARAVRWLGRIADGDPRRRPAVVAALARIDAPESMDALVALLRDERAGAAALDVLAGLPARRVVPALLEHCGEEVPAAVRRALTRIAGRDLGDAPATWRAWWQTRT